MQNSVKSSAEWGVSKEVLVSALRVLDLVPVRPGIQTSEQLLLGIMKNQNEVRLCLSSDISGTVVVQGTGVWPLKQSVVVDRRLLFPFVWAGKGFESIIRVSGHEKQLVVRQGRRTVELEVGTVMLGYGKVPDMTGAVRFNCTPEFRSVLSLARFCATRDMTVPELSCVYVQRLDEKKVGFVSTNQIVIYSGSALTKHVPSQPFPFPLELAELIGGWTGGTDETMVLFWKGVEVSLRLAGGWLWQTVNAAASKFPVKQIAVRVEEISKTPVAFRVPCSQFKAAVERLSQYLSSVRRHEWLLDVKGVQGGKDVIIGARVPQGRFEERLAVDGTLRSAVAAEWPFGLLVDLFKGFGGKGEMVTVRCNPTSPYLFSVGTERIVVSRLAKG